MSVKERRRIANVGMVFTAAAIVTAFASSIAMAWIPLTAAVVLALRLAWEDLR
jgi:hypothetical protein